MANDLISTEPSAGSAKRRNHARAHLRAGKFEAEIEVDISSRGLLAVGGLVSMILLSVAPIVVAATRGAPRIGHRHRH